MALNDNLEALKKLIAEAAQVAAKATKSAAAVTKANISILTEQEKLKKAYAELGKLYYRDYITGEEPDDAEYIPLCDAITEATKNIDAQKGTLEDLWPAKDPKDAEEAEPVEEAAEEEPVEEAAEAPAKATPEEELQQLHKDLDDLQQELHKLDGVEEAPVFEVVEPQNEEKAE